MIDWAGTLLQLIEREESFVIVTVAATRGSTPRETGAKMFVTPTRTLGTIGGGQLEHECTAAACEWFRKDTPPQTFARTFTLGADCGQCCGGVAEILFEQIVPGEIAWRADLESIADSPVPAAMVTAGDTRTGVIKRFITTATRPAVDDAIGQWAVSRLAANTPAGRMTIAIDNTVQVPALFEPLQPGRFPVVIFGAGHVGSALVASLAPLPCDVTWIDSRDTIFPDELPDTVSKICIDQPQTMVDHLPGGCYFLIMTHSHAIDLEICARILARDDFSYCGLIGSRSKRRQFEKRLHAMGLSDRQLRRLTCPIGVDGIAGKKPAEIAIATTAQLLQKREAQCRAERLPQSAPDRQHNQ